MRRREPIVTWVVYERQKAGKPKMTVMCEQAEWDALALADPDHCTLIRAGITNEGEAERLARSGAVVENVKAARPQPAAGDGAVPGTDRDQKAVTEFWAQATRFAAAEPPATASRISG